MTRANVEQQKHTPWFAKAGAACSIVPISRFVGSSIFALKGGGYGCLFSLTGLDEEAFTDLELEARVRQVEGALRGLPVGSCLYQYTRVMSGFDLPRQKRYGSEVTERFANDRLAHLDKTAAFRRIDLHWCLTLEPSKAKAIERKPEENAVDTSRMLSDLEKTATLLEGHLGSSLGLRLLSKAEAFQFFSYLFNLEEWADRDQLREDTGVDRQIVKSAVAWHSDHVQVGKRHVQMFSLKTTPEASRPCLFSGLLTLDCDSVLCSTWRVKSTSAARSEIDAQEKFISFFKVGVLQRVMSGRDSASLDTGAGAKAANNNVDDLSEVIRSLDKKVQGEFSLRLLLAATSPDQLRDIVPTVHRVFVDARAQVMEETLGNLSAFYAMFPGNHKFNVFPLWLAEDHHARLSSVFAPHIGHPRSEDLDSEYLNIFETRTRTPFFQDVYVDGVRVMLIIGPTGTGNTMQEQFRVTGFDLAHPRIAKYLELSIRMLDLPRHLGQHSGGMIIAQGQLASVVPIEPASMPGRNVIQWDKEDVSDMGLIKVDMLGLGMMAVLKDCTNLIPQHYGKTVDIAQIPHDDRHVYASLRKADTIGLFQVESRAQMASLPRNNPDKFYDLVVQVAIIRPGPIVGKMMNPYMERRQGRQEITYPHPLLEPVLRRTLGVPLFQEQLLRIAMTIADFTGGEAEELRRALGSRRSADKMRALEIKLRDGMDKNQVGIAAQEEIIQSISSFALYGFPESHAASFALIAYASAWLKFHYLGAFTAAILNNQPMGFYSAAVLVKDAQRHGLRIRPIDVMRSCWPCTLEREEDGSLSLRLGLRFARGLRETAAVALEEARKLRDFASIEELARRVSSLSRADLSTLAEVGALNSIGEGSHRRDALWQVQRAGRQAGPLLESLDQDEEETSPLQAMNPEERMVADYAGTGVTVGRHPMAHCRDRLRSMNICRAKDLRMLRHGVYARIAGCVIARQRPGTAHGFIFLSIEDETGISNAIIDPELYERNRSLVTYTRFLIVEGTLQNVDKVIHIRARQIEELNVTAAPMQSHDFH